LGGVSDQTKGIVIAIAPSLKVDDPIKGIALREVISPWRTVITDGTSFSGIGEVVYGEGD